MLHRLPYDIQVSVVRLLSTKDVIRLCSTCKTLYSLMSDRSLWYISLSRILLLFPQPLLSSHLARFTTEQLKARVIHSAQLDREWHRVDYVPRLVRNFHCGGSVEHINLVAGGEWLVVVLYDGSLQLHELGAPSPAVTLSPSLTDEESVFYLSSRLSYTDDHEDLIILQMGVRYNQCNIYVYRIAVVDPDPKFLLAAKISVVGSVWCCASGGRILVYGLESGSGDMVLHVCSVGPDAPEPKRPRVSMNIGPWSADEDFSISVLTERKLLLAYHGGLSLYEIPPLLPDDAPDASNALPETPVTPVWSRRCDIGSGIYRISPFSWDAHRHPLVIAGSQALHVLRVRPPAEGSPAHHAGHKDSSNVDYREVPYPLAPGAELGHVGLGAVGLRRAIWDSTEERNGALHVHFRTYSLPRSILDLGADDPDFGAAELGGRGCLGSFSVQLDPQEHLLNLCLDEASGRVCLLLNNILTGARRITVIDAV
ncbi:hypothetical protein BD413DRAFT_489629 [Trametes elegans]|nr:hypothetical protein BD413DRAFT_489629 [Trametes elegans]